jgi:PKD repeat protein
VKPSKSPGASGAPTHTPPPTTGTPPPATDTPEPPTPPPPVASFTYSETAACEIQFTNTSTGDTSWDWDFGDLVGSSSAQNPTYTYALGPGTYSVKLTINGGADSITKSVSVEGSCPL